MDWLHCNSCFVQPASGNGRKYYITSQCTHIVCSLCMHQYQKSPYKKCPVCKREKQEMIYINPYKIPRQYYNLFQDPSGHMEEVGKSLKSSVDMLNKACSVLSETLSHVNSAGECMKYQRKQSLKLKNFCIQKDRKMEAELEKREEEVKSLKQELQMLRQHPEMSSADSRYHFSPQTNSRSPYDDSPSQMRRKGRITLRKTPEKSPQDHLESPQVQRSTSGGSNGPLGVIQSQSVQRTRPAAPLNVPNRMPLPNGLMTATAGAPQQMMQPGSGQTFPGMRPIGSTFPQNVLYHQPRQPQPGLVPQYGTGMPVVPACHMAT